MMIGSENIATSAEKILQAATELFAMNNFNAVSIKQIIGGSDQNCPQEKELEKGKMFV